jgi:hypothetical protein
MISFRPPLPLNRVMMGTQTHMHKDYSKPPSRHYSKETIVNLPVGTTPKRLIMVNLPVGIWGVELGV